jgi:anti-sigma regulatory factor (Ser/Thr protein kinase)
MMFCQLAVTVSDITQIGEVRRQANRIAANAGLNDSDCGKASIVATELATNLVRYSPGGEVLLRSLRDESAKGIELVAIDRGPGMTNIAHCLQDGFSTGGTAGQGLGAIQRLSTEFDIYSTQPGGSVVFSRIQIPKISETKAKDFAWGVINRAAPAEQLSGDTWRLAQRSSEFAVMVADGLGHGPLAADAAEAAAATFEENPFLPLKEYFVVADRRMRGTRGAAIALAQVNIASRALTYAGVGNISASLRSQQAPNAKGLVSHNGTVGATMRKVEPFVYECPDNALLVLHSDGLQHRWSLTEYPGLIHRHPAIIAAVLYRDFCRGRDDVTVVAVRFSTSVSETRFVA